MNRRKLFAVLSGLAASVGLIKGNEQSSEKSYTYDWVKYDGQETDDPEFADKRLPRGGPPINRIWLDGKEVSHLRITKIRIGRNGYIEYREHDGKKFVIEVYDHETGKSAKVEDFYNPHLDACINPNPERYEERTKMNTLRGHVCWEHS